MRRERGLNFLPVRFATVFAAAIAFGAGAAVAERVSFDTAARGSRMDQIFAGQAEYSDRIHGDLQLPSAGAGPFPAMVIMHSSRGIGGTIRGWAELFNAMGVATFTVDSFTPRSIAESNADQLTFPAGVADALRALATLQQDPRIDAKRIGVIGFSRGAIAAMYAGFERYRASVLGENGARFALHIPFYGGCAQYAKTTGAPILTVIGSADDFLNSDVCRRQTEILKQRGAQAELVVYDGALHGFDTDFSPQYMPAIPNSRNCMMLQDLDTLETVLIDGRALNTRERADYAHSCVGRGVVRGGDRKYASLAREQVRRFVAAHFNLQR